MIKVVTGGCLCGNVRYRCEGELGPANYCHCEDCRRCTGSAFNIGVRVEARQFRIVKGSPHAFTKLGESGNSLTRHFCPDCGSPLYTSSPIHPEVLYVKAGSIDDPAIVHPMHQSVRKSREVEWNGVNFFDPRGSALPRQCLASHRSPQPQLTFLF